MADDKKNDSKIAAPQIAANQPVKTVEQPASAKPGEDVKAVAIAEKKSRRKISALALFATTFLLFLLVVALLILALSVNPPGQVNPVLQFFGQNEDTVKDFLLNLVNISFGFFSIFLLITISVTLLLGFSQPKANKQKRAALFAFSLVSIGLQIVTLFAWFGMYNAVLALAASPDPNRGEIILTLPDGRSFDPPIDDDVMTGITTSTELIFSAKELIKKHEAVGNKISRIVWDTGVGDFDLGVGLEEITTTFPRTGEHTVRVNLLIQNSDGVNDGEVIKEISFFIPRAHLNVSPEDPVAGQKVIFDVSVLAAAYPGKKIMEWDFNNDSRPDAEESNPISEYTYSYPGPYTVKMRLKDSKGLVHTFEWPIIVGEPKTDLISVVINTTPKIEDPESRELKVEIGTAIKFDGSASNSPVGELVAYEWNISPGDSAPIKANSHTFSFKEEGYSEVVLKVTDERGNEGESSIIVNVVKKSAAPIARLEVLKPAMTGAGNVSGKAPFTVEFDASKSTDENDDISEYQWDADGDGIYEEERAGRERVSHTYRKGGTFKATLLVRDKDGNENTATVIIVVTEIKLTASASASTREAAAPRCEIAFDASASVCTGENCRIEAYEWDFGDGSTKFLSVPTVEHLYTRLGSFTARLTVHARQDDDAEKILTAADDVIVYCRDTPLNAAITASRITGNAPTTISFSSARSTGKIMRYVWDFGNGFTSEDPITQHTFSDAGEYMVTLTVYDRENSFAKSTQKITIHPR